MPDAAHAPGIRTAAPEDAAPVAELLRELGHPDNDVDGRFLKHLAPGASAHTYAARFPAAEPP